MTEEQKNEELKAAELWFKYNDTYLLMYGLVFFLTINEGAGLKALKESMEENGASDFLLASLDRIYKSSKAKCPIE